MKNLKTITITIKLKAPFLIHGSEPGKYGLDSVLIRDHLGRVIIPGSLLAGRIAEFWDVYGTEIENADKEKWFGKAGFGEEGQKGKIILDDLILNIAEISHIEKRIAIDEETETAKTGQIVFIEQIAKANKQLCFQGQWNVWANENEFEILLKQLEIGLILQTQLGAYRNIGFGENTSIQIDGDDALKSDFQFITGSNDKFLISLKTTSSFCTGAQVSRDNLYESSEVISGGTLLGVLATMLTSKYGVNNTEDIKTALANHFSSLRFSNAVPVSAENNKRTPPLPLSLIKYNGEIYDAYQYKDPPENLATAPEFQVDWKSFPSFRGETKRHLRVRTAINDMAVADEGKLFAYESVYSPINEDGEPETKWLCELDISNIPSEEKQEVLKEIQDFLSYGFLPLGKTKCKFSVEPENAPTTELPVFKQEQLVPVLLCSDTLLFTLEEISEDSFNLKDIYSNAFESLLGLSDCKDSIELSHFFAQQKLEGNDHLRKHYNKLDNPYNPVVLTSEGSVFVFIVKDMEKAKTLFSYWHQNGLSLPEKVENKYGATWKDHPWLSNSGYGEVAIGKQFDYKNFYIDEK